MNRFDNGWLPVKAEAHQNWPRKKRKKRKNEQRTMTNPERQREREKRKKRNKHTKATTTISIDIQQAHNTVDEIQSCQHTFGQEHLSFFLNIALS